MSWTWKSWGLHLVAKGLEVPCQNTFKDKPAFIKSLFKVLVARSLIVQFFNHTILGVLLQSLFTDTVALVRQSESHWTRKECNVNCEWKSRGRTWLIWIQCQSFICFLWKQRILKLSTNRGRIGLRRYTTTCERALPMCVVLWARCSRCTAWGERTSGHYRLQSAYQV